MLRYLLAVLLVLPIAACDSNSAESGDFNRVIITEVNIESWPTRKPNGDRWDGQPTADPDLYFELRDSGGQILQDFHDENARDVGDNEIGPQWLTNFVFDNFNRTLHFRVCDSDGDDCDVMADTESFSFMDLADQGFRTFLSLESEDEITIVTVRLQWER